MTDIALRLSLDEVNLVLEALGQQPYKTVHQLIASIHEQAAPQLRGDGAAQGGGGPSEPSGSEP